MQNSLRHWKRLLKQVSTLISTLIWSYKSNRISLNCFVWDFSLYIVSIDEHPYFLHLHSGQWERQPGHIQTAVDRLLLTPSKPTRRHCKSCVSLHPREDSAQSNLIWRTGRPQCVMKNTLNSVLEPYASYLSKSHALAGGFDQTTSCHNLWERGGLEERRPGSCGYPVGDRSKVSPLFSTCFHLDAPQIC